MNKMNNTKVMQVMEKYTFQKYLKHLIESEMHKITLFTSFPHTGVVNVSDPAQLIMIDDLSAIISLNTGALLN